MMRTSKGSYSELIQIPSYEERFEYLKRFIFGTGVGEDVFGMMRYLNQCFYQGMDWRNFRREIIVRDNGCDMAHKDYQIPEGIIPTIHHINPPTIEDYENKNLDILLNPENVVLMRRDTHKVLHFGHKENIPRNEFIVRKPNDTCPWR